MSRRNLEIYNAYYLAFKKINDMIFQFWTTPKTAEILDQDGQKVYQQYVGSQLKAEYSYQIGFSNEPPDSLNSRRQAALQLYATMAQDPTVDQIKLRQYMSNAFNDPAFSNIFKPGILAGDQHALVASQMQEQAMSGVAKAGGDVLAQQFAGAGQGGTGEGGV